MMVDVWGAAQPVNNLHAMVNACQMSVVHAACQDPIAHAVVASAQSHCGKLHQGRKCSLLLNNWQAKCFGSSCPPSLAFQLALPLFSVHPSARGVTSPGG